MSGVVGCSYGGDDHGGGDRDIAVVTTYKN